LLGGALASTALAFTRLVVLGGGASVFDIWAGILLLGVLPALAAAHLLYLGAPAGRATVS
jgi:hypothetical protein